MRAFFISVVLVASIGLASACDDSSPSSSTLAEILTLARSASSQLKADLTLSPFTTTVSPRNDIEVTDEAIAATDLEPFTLTPVPDAVTCK